MAMRVRDTPTGAVRVAYAYLATVVGGLGGLLVLAIVGPIISRAGVCSADETLFCGLAVGLIAWSLGTWLVMWWLASVMRLSWRFVVVDVALQLLLIQAVLQSDSLWWLVGLLVVPVAAGLLSDPGKSRQVPPRWQSLAIVVGGVVVLLEFPLWLWFGVLAGA